MAVSWCQEELKDMAFMLKLFRGCVWREESRRVKWEATEIGIPRKQEEAGAGRPMLSFLTPRDASEYPLHKCVSSAWLLLNQ